MKFLISILVNGLCVMLVSFFLKPYVAVDGLLTAIIVGATLGIVNMFIRPILLILTLPINIATLGLFTLIINGILVLAVSKLIAGFVVIGIVPAIFFSITLSVVNTVAGWFVG